MFGLDGSVLEGAFIVSAMIFTEKHGDDPLLSELAHEHDFDEAWIFMGTDMNNPKDLGGEIDFWLEDEHYVINKSCMIYVPKSMKRGLYGLSKLEKRKEHRANNSLSFPQLASTILTTSSYIMASGPLCVIE
jgi:hypothetical protein